MDKVPKFRVFRKNATKRAKFTTQILCCDGHFFYQNSSLL
jgi:hypothetical protein